MNNHKQEVIDGFVKAVLPALVKEELEQENDIFPADFEDSINTSYRIAEKLFEKHKQTCEICKGVKHE